MSRVISEKLPTEDYAVVCWTGRRDLGGSLVACVSGLLVAFCPCLRDGRNEKARHHWGRSRAEPTHIVEHCHLLLGRIGLALVRKGIERPKLQLVGGGSPIGSSQARRLSNDTRLKRRGGVGRVGVRVPVRHPRAVLLILFSDKSSVDGAMELMPRVVNAAKSILEAINGQICTSLPYRPMKLDGETIEGMAQ